MFYALYGLLLSLMIGLASPVTVAQEGTLTRKEIIALYKAAVVKIDREQIGDVKDWLGSGVFISPTEVLTNSHVVGDLPDSQTTFRAVYSDSDLARARFWVVFRGKKYPAKFVGRDPTVDLAILEVEKPIDGVRIGILGDSDPMEAGDEVFAFGNPYGMENTVTEGIVTAKEKVHGLLSHEDYIQTQAPINPGNSGGPLVSKANGTIIGIANSGIHGADGMGYAIPINLFKSIKHELVGTVRRSWIGIKFPAMGELKDAEEFQGLHVINELIGVDTIKVLQSIKDEIFLPKRGGVLVIDVLHALETVQFDPQRDPHISMSVNDIKTPAYKAGLRIGDVIKQFGAFEIKNSRDLMYAMLQSPPFNEIIITVARFMTNGSRYEEKLSVTPIIRVPESARSGHY